MNRALARIVVGALAPATLATPAGAVLKTWTGAGGNLLWSSPDNWDPVGVPGEGDDVVIGLPMAVEVIYAGGTTTIESLVCQCSIRFVSGTLCTVSTATVLGLPTLAGGSLRDGTWTLGQPLSVTSNANNRIDGVTIIGGIRLEFAGSQLRVANGLSVSGQVWLGGAGAVIRYENSQTWGPATLVAPAGANAKIEPFAGGAALTLASSFSLEGGGWTIAGGAMSPTVVNHGLLRTTAAGSAAINANTFANFGTVRSLAGTLSINSNLWTNPGGALQAIGATLRFGGGVFDNGGQNTALDPNTGTLLLDGATIMGGKLHLLPPGALMVSNSAANRLSSVEVMGNLSLLAAGSQLRTVKGLSVMGQVLVGPGSQLGFEGSQTWGPADVLAFGAPGNPARIGIALQPSSELMLTEDFSLDGSWWQFNSGAGLNAEIENWGWLESTMGQSLIGGAPFRNEGEVRALGGTLTLPPLLWNLDKGVLMHGTWTTEAGATMVWPMVTPEIEQLQSAIVNINGTMVGLPAEEGVAGGVPFPFEPLRTIDEDSILRIGPMRKLFFLPTDGTLANHGVLGIGAQSLASVGGGYSQSPEATLETAYDSVLEVPPLITGGDISLDGLLAVEFAKGFDPAACEPLFVVGTKGGSVVGTFGGIIPPCGGACPVTPFYGSDYAAIFSEGAVPDVACNEIVVQLDSSGMALVPGLDLIDTEKNECPIKSVEPSELSLDCADVGTRKVPVVVTYFNGLAIECTATVDVLPTPRYTGESGDWNDAENWCTGLPTADSDVTIHSTVGVTSDDAVAHGVVIQDGGTLRVGFENASGGPDQALLTVGASITIESGGALEILIDGAVSAGSITVMSGGTLRLDDSSSLLMVGSLTIEPGGVLEWIAGTIELSGVMQVPVDLEIGCIARPADGVTSSLLRLLGGTVVAPAVAICDAGTVDGAGAVISAFVSNSGVLTPGEPPASLLLTGDLLQNEGGTTEIRLAGTVPVQQYGVLNVSGNAGFEGTVDIVLDAPFVPKSGDLFAVIAVAGTVDPEAIPSLPPLPPGLEWSASWQTVATVTSLVLEVIEPGVACRNAQLQLGPDGTAILQPEQVIGDSGQCDIVDVELSQSFFDCSNVGPNMVEVTIFCKSGSMFTCDAQVTVLPTPRYQGPAFGSWFDVENWCSGLPTELSDVTVFNTVIVDDGNALAQNLTIENGGTVIVGSFDPLVGEPTGGSLTVASTITIQQGGKLLIAPGGFVDALTVLVQPGAMLEIDGGELDAVGIVVLPGGSAKLSNGALLVLVNATLSMASTLDWLDGTIVVSGTLNSEIAFQIGCVLATQDQGGGESTLVLDGGTVTAPSVTICALGTLIGTGTVNSPSVTNSGEIAPGTSPGAITIQGTLDNMPTGVIRLEIAGLDPGTGYDLLTTTASGSTVGGVIIVSLDGFEPACSDSFEMIRIRLASTIQPPDATLAALPGGFYWSVQWVTIANEAVFTVTVRRVADFNFDCVVDGDDLGTMLGAWGPCEGCPEDLNDDGEVNGDDLGSLLGLWS